MSHQIPEHSDSTAIAGGFVRMLQDIRIVLSPILGARGATALLQRSLHLASHRFPAIPRPPADESVIDDAAVHAALVAQDAASARAAVDGALQCFHELLSSLIGVPLTERLFESVWASPASGSAAQEPKP